MTNFGVCNLRIIYRCWWPIFKFVKWWKFTTKKSNYIFYIYLKAFNFLDKVYNNFKDVLIFLKKV